MADRHLIIREPRSGLHVTARLLTDKAPQNGDFLWRYLTAERIVSAIHAMWTGPEISCPIPANQLADMQHIAPLPAENATIHPQPGDIVLSYVPARMWGGNPEPIFDIGLFYGPGARLLFPIGWLPGSVVAQVDEHQRADLAKACNAIRRSGACDITFAQGESQ